MRACVGERASRESAPGLGPRREREPEPVPEPVSEAERDKVELGTAAYAMAPYCICAHFPGAAAGVGLANGSIPRQSRDEYEETGMGQVGGDGYAPVTNGVMVFRSAMLGLVGPLDMPATLVLAMRVGLPAVPVLRCDRAYHAMMRPSRTMAATPPTTPPAIAAVCDVVLVAANPEVVPLPATVVSEATAVMNVVTIGTDVAVPLIVVCDSNVFTTEEERVIVVSVSVEDDCWRDVVVEVSDVVGDGVVVVSAVGVCVVLGELEVDWSTTTVLLGVADEVELLEHVKTPSPLLA